MTTAQIILSHNGDTDYTSYPFWAIVRDTEKGHRIFLDGIWFNRPDAEQELERKRSERYGPEAYVYCFSGCCSEHLKEMYRNAKSDVKDGQP